MVGSVFILYRTSLPRQISLGVPETQPLVSIIIPARNEEQNLPRLLDSLVQLNYPAVEILVIDGHSTDRTADVATSYPGVEVIAEPPRPQEWVGKPWACYTGYKQASGQILLFTDADTYHTPDSLNTTVKALQQSRGFLTLLTTQEFGSFWEHILAIVFLIISISVRGSQGTSRANIANGQYMMFTRQCYESLGTHQVVKNSIIEDLAMGTHAASRGVPPFLCAHHNLVTTRMYRNLAGIREGFGKNLALGVNQTGFGSILSAGVITFWGLGGFLILFIQLLVGDLPALVIWDWLILLLGYTSFVLVLFLLEKNISTRGTVYVLLYPMYFLVFELIVLVSFFQTFIRKEITWKGQQYEVS